MNVGDVCTRNVVTCLADASLAQVSVRMRDQHVGAVVIVDAESSRRPIGLVTDRDIVLAVVAPGLEASVITAGDLLVDPLVTIAEDSDVIDAIRTMRARSVRRLPVVTADGALAGIVTMNDLVHLFSTEMGNLARLIERQPRREAKRRP